MALYKTAQLFNAEDNEIDIEDIGDDDQVILYEDKPSPEDVIEAHSLPMGEDSVEISFKLPSLPGSEAPLEVSTDDPIEVVEEDHTKSKKSDKNEVKEVENTDPWTSWKEKGPKHLCNWAKDMLQFIPRHNGNTVAGCERAAAFLERLQKELSAGVRSDLMGDIEIEEFEKIRNEIDSGIDRLYEAAKHMGKKKKTSTNSIRQDNELVKEAAGTTPIHGAIITIPQIISTLARIAVNSCVSAGHDIEKVADYLIKKYELSKREQLEFVQTVSDMGFPMRRDRGLGLDEKFDPTSSNNYDMSSNYPA